MTFIWNIITNRPLLCFTLLLTIPFDLLCLTLLILAYILGFCVVIVISLLYDTFRAIFHNFETSSSFDCFAWALILIAGFPLVVVVYWFIGIFDRTRNNLFPLLNPYMLRIC